MRDEDGNLFEPAEVMNLLNDLRLDIDSLTVKGDAGERFAGGGVHDRPADPSSPPEPDFNVPLVCLRFEVEAVRLQRRVTLSTHLELHGGRLHLCEEELAVF